MADRLQMHLRVISPERVVFDDDVDEVTLNTKDGQITVMPNHIPLISVLIPGDMVIRSRGRDVQRGTEDAGEVPLVVSGGFVEVGQNEVRILADTAEHINELDLERAEKAVEYAQSLLADKSFDVSEYESLRQNLAKNIARVSAFTKWRK